MLLCSELTSYMAHSTLRRKSVGCLATALVLRRRGATEGQIRQGYAGMELELHVVFKEASQVQCIVTPK